MAAETVAVPVTAGLETAEMVAVQVVAAVRVIPVVINPAAVAKAMPR